MKNQIGPTNRLIPAHPFLFAIFPIVSLLATNISEVEPDVIFGPAMAALAAAAVIFLTSWVFLRNAAKGALLATFWVFLFFSFGHVYNSMVDVRFIAAGGQARYLLAAWIVLGLAGSFALVKTKGNLANPTRFLNFIGIVILVLPLINVVQYERTRNSTLTARSLNMTAGDQTAAPSTKKTDPDIYYLIFDRYSSALALKRALSFDNSQFTDRLKQRGFFVAEKSRANYPVTYLSLASSLNLDYHEKARDQKAMEDSLQDYRAWRFLKERGYKYIHYGSAWPPTHSNRFADQSVNYYESNFDSFSRLLINTTMAGPVMDKFNPPERRDRDRLLFQLKALSKAPEIKGPKFVFAHVLLPHSPYSFDANGRPLTAREQNEKSEIELYQDYIRFANKKIESLIDDIIVGSERPPVIIVQADEGFRFNAKTNEERYRKPGYMELHYGILNAFYLPDVKADRVVYDSITPVNSFRAVFNAYFDAGFELLDDENYMLISTGNSARGFERVTDKLRKN